METQITVTEDFWRGVRFGVTGGLALWLIIGYAFYVALA